MRQRLLLSRDTSTSLRNSIANLAERTLGAGHALVARGSLATGALGPVSDLDVVVLVRRPPLPPTADLVGEFEEKFGRPVSCTVWGVEEWGRDQRRLSTWHALASGRCLAGDRGLWVEWQKQAAGTLVQLSGSRLVSLDTDDPKRHVRRADFLTPYSRDLKRGTGGILDYEFAKLARIWLQLRQVWMGIDQSAWNRAHFLSEMLIYYKLAIQDHIGIRSDSIDYVHCLGNDVPGSVAHCLRVMRGNHCQTTRIREVLLELDRKSS